MQRQATIARLHPTSQRQFATPFGLTAKSLGCSPEKGTVDEGISRVVCNLVRSVGPVMWHKMATTVSYRNRAAKLARQRRIRRQRSTARRRPGSATPQLATAPFLLFFGRHYLRHNDANVNPLPAADLMAMNGNGIFARMQRGQCRRGNLKLTVIGDESGQSRRQRAV